MFLKFIWNFKLSDQTMPYPIVWIRLSQDRFDVQTYRDHITNRPWSHNIIRAKIYFWIINWVIWSRKIHHISLELSCGEVPICDVWFDHCFVCKSNAHFFGIYIYKYIYNYIHIYIYIYIESLQCITDITVCIAYRSVHSRKHTERMIHGNVSMLNHLAYIHTDIWLVKAYVSIWKTYTVPRYIFHLSKLTTECINDVDNITDQDVFMILDTKTLVLFGCFGVQITPKYWCLIRTLRRRERDSCREACFQCFHWYPNIDRCPKIGFTDPTYK